ncbi:MAG: hypothetical protein FWD88_01595, partial [Treponema sp.]|nr:hypothetical protein [Treponema sp.]
FPYLPSRSVYIVPLYIFRGVNAVALGSGAGQQHLTFALAEMGFSLCLPHKFGHFNRHFAA